MTLVSTLVGIWLAPTFVVGAVTAAVTQSAPTTALVSTALLIWPWHAAKLGYTWFNRKVRSRWVRS